MSGSIDDVDLHAVVTHAGDLGQNGDASLALEVVGIHHAFDVLLMSTEDAALVEHGVDESGLAMIDVSDDGDITDIRIAAFHWFGYSRAHSPNRIRKRSSTCCMIGGDTRPRRRLSLCLETVRTSSHWI